MLEAEGAVAWSTKQGEGIGRGLFREVCRCLCSSSRRSVEEMGLVIISAAPFDKASPTQLEVRCAV